MWERLRKWQHDARLRHAFRQQLCDHDGSEPLCDNCKVAESAW